MLAKYLVYFALIRLSSQAEFMCEKSIQPQLSPTFLDGLWYEHLYTNNVLNKDPCSHFQISCNNDSSCTLSHVRWDSYCLTTIYNGIITQGKDKIVLNITEAKEELYDIRIKYDGTSVLIWGCNNDDLVFASLLRRMQNAEDMEQVWDEAESNKNYFRILEGFPAGIWKKINTTQCVNTANNIFINYYLVVILIVLDSFLQM